MRNLLILIIGYWVLPVRPALSQPTSYKYQVIQQVCRQLATAYGEKRLPKLTLTTSPASQRIAQFVAQPEPELFLDEKLYDICRGFKADSLAALAIVLGHELAHYYGKHADWFGFAQLLRNQRPTAVQAQQTEVLEAQADMQGVYRAFLAGYDTYRLARPLYMAIYAAYRLPDQMPGYLSRESRIRLVDEQARKANTLGLGFDAGLFFLLKGDYRTAQRCFDFVAEEMPAKEVLVNMAACQLLRVAEKATLSELPFRYPFEVATDNRLRQNDHRGGEIDKTDLLKQAVSFCRQAIDIDETYVPAYINQGAALSMLGRTGTAKETIDQLAEVLRRTNEPLPPNARLIRAIALIEGGATPAGVTELEQSTGAYELDYNQAVARQHASLVTLPGPAATQVLTQLADRYTTPVSELQLSPENSVGAIRVPAGNTVTFTEQLSIPEPYLVRLQCYSGVDATVYRIVLRQDGYEVIHTRPRSLARSGLGVKSGDAVALLTQRYGSPSRILSAADGLAYYCYDSANFFVAVQQDTVKNWFVYVTR